VRTRRIGHAPEVDCTAAREALSAWLDGEPAMHSSAAVNGHVTGCDECRSWQEAAHRLTRSTRLTPARAMTDDTARILEAVMADRKVRRPPLRNTLKNSRRLFFRGGLAMAAMGQLAITVPALVLGDAGVGVPLHASRELGAFNLALAVGFVLAALRPKLARGMLPLVAVATFGLIVVVAVDTAWGATTLLAEVPHLITVAGMALLFLIAEPPPPPLPGYNRG
jgi:predicted anti-sigma-YlaC factor YlaD